MVESTDQLSDEEPACIFSHATHELASVKKQSTFYKLHNDVDQVINLTSWRLYDFSLVSEVKEFDNSIVLHVFENSDLVLNWINGVLISLKELFLKHFNGNKVVLVVQISGKVNLRGISLTKRFDNFIAIVEYRMCLMIHLFAELFEYVNFIN